MAKYQLTTIFWPNCQLTTNPISTLLFTFGSIYSTKTSGTDQTTETNNSNETQQGQESYLKPDGYLQVSITVSDRSQGFCLVSEM